MRRYTQRDMDRDAIDLARLFLILFLANCAAALVFVSVASAQEPCQELRAAPTQEPTALENRGVAGMWFPMATARLVLCEVQAFRLGRQEVRLVDAELQLWAQRVEIVREQLRAQTEARDALEGVVTAAERRASAAEAERDAWWRSPFLWFALGGIAAGALLVLAGGIVASL